MKKRTIKTLLAAFVSVSILASIFGFKDIGKNDKEKNWNIEIILNGGNSADINLKVTSIDEGKLIKEKFDLGKDMVPQGPMSVQVKNKDELKKVLVTRDDAVNYEVEIEITETLASTGKKTEEKTFTMPSFEKEFLIVWND